MSLTWLNWTSWRHKKLVLWILFHFLFSDRFALGIGKDASCQIKCLRLCSSIIPVFLTQHLFLNVRSIAEYFPFLFLMPHEMPWARMLNRCWAVASEGSTKNRDSGNAVEICPSISKPNYGDHHRQEFPAMRKTAKNYAVSIWFASTPVLERPKFPNCGQNKVWSINPTPHWKRDVHGQRREMSRESKYLKRIRQKKSKTAWDSLEIRGTDNPLRF